MVQEISYCSTAPSFGPTLRQTYATGEMCHLGPRACLFGSAMSSSPFDTQSSPGIHLCHLPPTPLIKSQNKLRE